MTSGLPTHRWALLLLAAGCSPAAPGADPGDPAGGDALGAGDDAPAVSCPPAGPFGYEVGDDIVDLVFTDCDGAEVGLHDLCGARLGMVINVYGWCATCWGWLDLAVELEAEHGDEGLSVIAVVTEDAFEQPPDANYCRGVRDHAGLQTVVMDPEATLEAYGRTDL